MTNRARLTILLLVIMPTVAQAQSEFEGTYRCTLVDIVKAFEPDGRLSSTRAGWANNLASLFKSFTINVSTGEGSGGNWRVLAARETGGLGLRRHDQP